MSQAQVECKTSARGSDHVLEIWSGVGGVKV